MILSSTTPILADLTSKTLSDKIGFVALLWACISSFWLEKHINQLISTTNHITFDPRLKVLRGVQNLFFGVESLTLFIAISTATVRAIAEDAAAFSKETALGDLIRGIGGCDSLLLGIEDLTGFHRASAATAVIAIDAAALSEDITLSDLVRGLGRADGLLLSVENFAVVIGPGTAAVAVVAEDAATLHEDITLGDFL